MPSQPSPPVLAARQLAGAGRHAEAEGAYKRALQRSPRDALVTHELAVMLLNSGQIEKSLYFFERAAELLPTNADVRSHVGGVLTMLGRHERAAAEFRRALAMSPGTPNIRAGLGQTLTYMGRFDEADAVIAEGLRLAPTDAGLLHSWAALSRHLGRASEAVATLARAVELYPADHELWQMYCFAVNCSDAGLEPDGPARVFEVHRRYARALGAAAGPIQVPPFTNTPDPERPLRVGYCSADLREHSVAHFFEPILEHHDRGTVEVFIYSSDPAEPDEVSRRLRSYPCVWRDVARTPDPALASGIRADRIDVLVDLSGHTTGTRLSAMLRRPAPAQATYLGYPATTGVPTIDSRIVDALTDPPGGQGEGADRFATERLVRVDGCFLCYRPPAGAPDATPRDPDAPITFGSFNSPHKIGTSERGTLPLWAGVLQAVPDSRLILKGAAFMNASARERFLAAFAARGVDPARVELARQFDSKRDHLAAYARVDIALDPIPYNGATTTCEALWMGVPVVTLAGESGLHASRVGLSLLTAAGLPELVASSRDEYVRLCRDLAADAPRLASLRATLRERLRASPLCDGPSMARRLEGAYRLMWRRWCGSEH